MVKDCMDTRVHTVRPDTDIMEAVAFLLKKHVTGAPVVDEDRNLLGMLTEKDCLELLTAGVEANAPRGKVESFMETELVTIPPDMDVYYAAGLFLNHSFRRLPVVENGKLVGAITRFDILRVIEACLR
jgi:CBS domain-containing protein